MPVRGSDGGSGPGAGGNVQYVPPQAPRPHEVESPPTPRTMSQAERWSTQRRAAQRRHVQDERFLNEYRRRQQREEKSGSEAPGTTSSMGPFV